MSIVIGNSDFKPVPTNAAAKITGVHESLLQDCEKDIIWYRDNFFGKGKKNEKLGDALLPSPAPLLSLPSTLPFTLILFPKRKNREHDDKKNMHTVGKATEGLLLSILFSILEHYNYLALDSPRGPLAISVIQDGDVFKALVRTTNVS